MEVAPLDLTHYCGLLAGYAIAMVGWLVAARLFPALWPRPEAAVFPHPWREVGWALLGVVGVLGIGQLYVRHWLLPTHDLLVPLIEVGNQVLIFSPILAVPLLRHHGLGTVWIRVDRIWARLLVGVVLAALAVLAFALVRLGSDNWLEGYSRVFQPKNVGLLVQVFCEDVAIAILFVRLCAAIGLWGTIVLVASLFAATHIPAMIATGASFGEFARLVMDVGLATVVLFIVQRSADIWWFWCVHFAMDMTQFVAVPPSTA
jgi:hypothetical protein